MAGMQNNHDQICGRWRQPIRNFLVLGVRRQKNISFLIYKLNDCPTQVLERHGMINYVIHQLNRHVHGSGL